MPRAECWMSIGSRFHGEMDDDHFIYVASEGGYSILVSIGLLRSTATNWPGSTRSAP